MIFSQIHVNPGSHLSELDIVGSELPNLEHEQDQTAAPSFLDVDFPNHPWFTRDSVVCHPSIYLIVIHCCGPLALRVGYVLQKGSTYSTVSSRLN